MENGLQNADALYGGEFDEIEPIQKEVTGRGDRPLITITVNAKVRKDTNWKRVSMKRVIKACSTALRSTLESITETCKSHNTNG